MRTQEEIVQELAEMFAPHVTIRELIIWKIEAKIIAYYWKLRLWVEEHV